VNLQLILILLLTLSCSQPSKIRRLGFNNNALRSPDSLFEDKVGIEATLTNSFLQSNEKLLPPELDSYLESLIVQLKMLCDQCVIKSYTGLSYEKEYKVTFPDGFSFNVGRDQRVLEITADPISFDDLSLHTRKISDYLIIAGERIGLSPARHTGGGHLHFDFQAFFQEDRLLFRDFMVDYYNNQMVFEEYFGGENNNAPVIDQLPASSQENFIKIVKDFDESPFSIYEFMTRLNGEVYHQTFNEAYTPANKYQAISLIHAFREGGTVELRSIRPYQSGESVELIADMFFKRRDYLKNLRKEGNYPIVKSSSFKGLLPTRDRFKRVKAYLKESNLDPKKYYQLFPKEAFPYIWKDLGSEDQYKFLEGYFLKTPFDFIERVDGFFSKGVLSKLTLDQRRSLLKILMRKVIQSTNQDNLLKNVMNYKKYLPFDLSKIKEEIELETREVPGCGSLIRPLL